MLGGKPRDKLLVENCIRSLSTGYGPRAFNAQGDSGTKRNTRSLVWIEWVSCETGKGQEMNKQVGAR